jgi:hypothetical protein
MPSLNKAAGKRKMNRGALILVLIPVYRGYGVIWPPPVVPWLGGAGMGANTNTVPQPPRWWRGIGNKRQFANYANQLHP